MVRARGPRPKLPTAKETAPRHVVVQLTAFIMYTLMNLANYFLNNFIFFFFILHFLSIYTEKFTAMIKINFEMIVSKNKTKNILSSEIKIKIKKKSSYCKFISQYYFFFFFACWHSVLNDNALKRDFPLYHSRYNLCHLVSINSRKLYY